MSKLYLEPERSMETNPSTHPRAVQKTWTIRRRYGRKYAEIRISLTVSLSDGRRLTGLRRPHKDIEIIPRVSMTSEKGVSGEPVHWRVVEPLPQVLLQKKGTKKVSVDQKFQQHLPCTGRFTKPAINMARRPTITYIADMGTKANKHIYNEISPNMAA